ncbi:MICOS complex subunit MIC13-like [Acanthaster planci]|uniref:MICOS complex subunit MIC13 n=1 Tax=Acanthaster planci TaxID=133434 RepID=A0A8B7Z4H5_ACAPL|nr:MICOS complex subunit MIC13-like [Acanthaster planci]
MAVAVIKGLGKLAIGAGAVYVTVDQGIWSASPEGTSTLRNLTGAYSIPSREDYLQQMPSAKGIVTQLQEGWNSGVKSTFAYVAAAPEKVGYLASSTRSWFVDSTSGSDN